jgi:preprotein translocase subunit YajC
MNSSIISAAWPFVIMAALFYFMLYRPQKNEQKKRATMLNSLKVGSKVITIGGIYGEITKIHDDKITLKIADNVEIRILRSAVGNPQHTSNTVKPAETKKADKAEAKKPETKQPETPAPAAEAKTETTAAPEQKNG